MQESINMSMLSISVYPVYNYTIGANEQKINYVILEIDASKTHIFDSLLKRMDYSENDQFKDELNDPMSDYYERIVVHVEISADTRFYQNMNFFVHTSFQDVSFSPNNYLSAKEIKMIYDEGIRQIRKWVPRNKNRKRKNNRNRQYR